MKPRTKGPLRHDRNSWSETGEQSLATAGSLAGWMINAFEEPIRLGGVKGLHDDQRTNTFVS